MHGERGLASYGTTANDEHKLRLGSPLPSASEHLGVQAQLICCQGNESREGNLTHLVSRDCLIRCSQVFPSSFFLSVTVAERREQADRTLSSPVGMGEEGEEGGDAN